MAKQIQLRKRRREQLRKARQFPRLPNRARDGCGLLNYREAANYLGVAQGTLENWICSGLYSVPHIRVGRLIRFRPASLTRWLESREQNTGQVATMAATEMTSEAK